jgi:outer membrane lipoprotein-sorting protein
MQKTLICLLLSVFVLGPLTAPCYSQDAAEILAKVIEAQGGRKVLAGIKDSTSTADMELIMMGISGTGTMYNKEPNKMRLDMEFMGMLMTQAYDGETAWQINPQTGGVEEMPAEIAAMLRDTSFGNSALLEPEKYGITYKYQGKQSIDGKEYLVLDRVHSSDYTITFLIDPETYLIARIKNKSYDEMMAEIEEETLLSDYKKVDGVPTPHTITVLRDGVEFVILTLTAVSFNEGLEDSFFQMEK